jgi:hypothetical protein
VAFRHVLRRAIIGAGVLAFAFEPSVGAAQTDVPALIKELGAIKTSLEKAKITKNQITDDKVILDVVHELIRLRAANKGISLEIAKAQVSSDLLDANFVKKPESWPQAFAEAIKEIADNFDGLYFSHDPNLAFRRRAEILERNLGQLAKNDTRIVGAVTTLLEKLVGFIPSGAIPMAEAAYKDLKTLIENEPQRNVLLTNPESLKTLVDLRKKLAVFTTREENRIHIVGALYGDVNAIFRVMRKGGVVSNNPHDRWCVASAALSKPCERKARCEFDAAFVFRTKLCGYDPAPFLAPAHKAAVVMYHCLPNSDDELWHDRNGEASDTLDLDAASSSRIALLYGDSQTFSCAPPDGG